MMLRNPIAGAAVIVPVVVCILQNACVNAVSKASGALMTQTLPIDEHEVTARGQVPKWLKGTLIRNVPNTYEMGNDEVWSWTDALGSIHLLKLNGTNHATHLAKNLETVSYKKAVETNGLPFTQFMTPKNGGPRPRGGHVPFPCFSGPCLPDERAQHSLGHPQPLNTRPPRTSEQLEAQSNPIADRLAVNPNVDIARYVTANGTEMYLGLTDQTMYAAFDASTGATTDPGPCPWHDSVCKGMLADTHLSAAHEKYDYDTKEHINFMGSFGMLSSDTYQLWSYTDGQQTFERKLGPAFKVKNLSFVHSSHMTRESFIIQQPPVNYNFRKLLFNTPAFNASVYDTSVPVQWHVLDRSTFGLVKTYSAANAKWVGPHGSLSRQTMFRGAGGPGEFFHTHTVNAFETETNITMDFIGFPDNAIFYGIGLELMIDNPRDYMKTWEPARLTRCVINKSNEEVQCEIIVAENFGLPAFNIERYQTKPYRFAYACSVRNASTSDFIDQIIKVDIDARAVTHRWYEEGTFVTEPVFVAKPDGKLEDDGILISVVFDANQGESGLSFVVILDAHDLSELARLDLGYKMQAHYHGKFCKAYGDHSCVGH
jgi:carotenoid cleavage dioxygenase-like enzyme